MEENGTFVEPKTRESLIAEKIEVDRKINKLRAYITELKTKSRMLHQYTDPQKYQGIRMSLADLIARSQEIQLQLGKMPKPPRPGSTYPQVFIEIAERELDPLTFEIIHQKACTEAKKRMGNRGNTTTH